MLTKESIETELKCRDRQADAWTARSSTNPNELSDYHLMNHPEASELVDVSTNGRVEFRGSYTYEAAREQKQPQCSAHIRTIPFPIAKPGCTGKKAAFMPRPSPVNLHRFRAKDQVSALLSQTRAFASQPGKLQPDVLSAYCQYLAASSGLQVSVPVRSARLRGESYSNLQNSTATSPANVRLRHASARDRCITTPTRMNVAERYRPFSAGQLKQLATCEASILE